jgi:ssDNA-binding Zn-finger/Zn-ribbon topoisomerase 1
MKCPKCGSEIRVYNCRYCDLEMCEEPDDCADCFDATLPEPQIRQHYRPVRCYECGHEEKVGGEKG